MREYKFRLIKDNKIVGYELHRPKRNNFDSVIMHSIKNDDSPGYEWNNIIFLSHQFIEYDEKNLYIGINDKKGKNIFEGDYDPKYGVIMYLGCEFVFANIDGYTSPDGLDDIEITDNIYENQRLLKIGL